MADIQWIKLSVDIFENRKIKRILAMPRGNEMLLFWIRLLCLGGRINHGGKLMFTEMQPYDDKGLAIECNLSPELTKQWLDVFVSFGMISWKNGIYRITGWEKYQNLDKMEQIRIQNRLRKQKQRAHEKCEVSRDMSRDSHVTVTPCHATEKEEEKEEEQEQENTLSISLPRKEGEGALLARERLGGRLGQGLVMISDAQMEDLLERLSLDEFDHYVSAVAECERKGKHFAKSHYQAILEMAAKDRRVLQAKSDEVRT